MPFAKTAAAQLRAATGASVWTGSALQRAPSRWRFTLTPAEVADLHSATQRLLAQQPDGPAADGLRLSQLQSAQRDFPLPVLGPRLAALRRLALSQGLVVLRGLPVEQWTRREVCGAFVGLGLHWGSPVSQNAQGHALGHVRDLGHDASDPTTRIYTTNAAQPFHTDSADLVALLCLRAAAAGGESRVVSSAAVHNDLLERSPDHLAHLLRPLPNSRKGEVPKGCDPWFFMPVFCHAEAEAEAAAAAEAEVVVNSMYDRSFIRAAAHHPELEPLTAEEEAALDAADEAAERLSLSMHLEPGDVQLLHNHAVWHSRAAYRDDPAMPRHLLRLWLSVPDGRHLPPAFVGRYTSGVELGTVRGGVRVREDAQLVAPWDVQPSTSSSKQAS